VIVCVSFLSFVICDDRVYYTEVDDVATGEDIPQVVDKVILK